MSAAHEELEARVSPGELSVKPGTIRRGPDASESAGQALLEATGAASPQEAVRMAVGRPPVGSEAGPSPVVRARVPQALKESIAALAQLDHRAESDIVREALAAYVQQRQAS